jgi:hypothetical protein
VSSTLVPSCGIWWGASAGAGTDRTKSLATFEGVSSPTDIYHAYHKLGELFPTPLEISLARQAGHKRLLLINYKPEGGRTWAQVANGGSDAQLDAEAAYIKKNFPEKFFLTIHHEPEEEVRQTSGSGYTAQDYRAMYRHVIQRLRAKGVSNAVPVFNVMGTQTYGIQPWFDTLYPGDDVVSWIAADPYGCVSAKTCDSFANMMNRRFSTSTPWPGFYNWAQTKHPGKPIMLAEWGVFSNQGQTAKTNFINTVARDLPKFPALKAMVYFNSPSPRGDTLIYPGTAPAAAMQRLAASSLFTTQQP